MLKGDHPTGRQPSEGGWGVKNRCNKIGQNGRILNQWDCFVISVISMAQRPPSVK
jgi:hypothetical protein